MNERKQGCAVEVKVAVQEAPGFGPSYGGASVVDMDLSGKRFASPWQTVGPGEGTVGPQLPSPRGPISHAVVKAVSRPSGPFTLPPVRTDDALTDEDLQLALYCCYELHYQGFGRLSNDWEWNPGLLRLRSELEEAFEQHLRSALTNDSDIAATDVPDALWRLTRENGFSLSGWLLEHGSRFHAERSRFTGPVTSSRRQILTHGRFLVFDGRAKAAMVTIQADEYGNGVVSSMHSSLFADAMTALDLDPTYGAYLDRLPAVTLATTNLISMFGLHRRLRGAVIGNLAGFEMNSVGPMSRYSAWLKSLGVPKRGRRFYDIHVEADEVHQHIAVNELVGGFLETEPDQAEAVLFGAKALALIERNFSQHVVSAWENHQTSLWTP